ncbi:MAG: hypothetical protein QM488_02705 [Rhizobiaceae bacterium]
MNSLIRSLFFAVLLIGLSGCASTKKMSDSLILSSVSALAQPLSAGILGGNFGQSLDRTSMSRAIQAEYIALEKGRSGSPVTWKGLSEISGKVIPQQPYQVGSSDCRRYEHILQDGAVEKRATGTACRNDKGSWVPLK